jgi:hypothetical protein
LKHFVEEILNSTEKRAIGIDKDITAEVNRIRLLPGSPPPRLTTRELNTIRSIYDLDDSQKSWIQAKIEEALQRFRINPFKGDPFIVIDKPEDEVVYMNIRKIGYYLLAS